MSSQGRTDNQVAEEHKRRISQVEAVKAHAREHYTEGGWDVIVECWEDRQIEHALAYSPDPIVTDEQAIAYFAHGAVAVWADRQADARNSAF